MDEGKKNPSTLILVIIAIAAAALSGFLIWQFFNRVPDVNRALVTLSDQVNKKLPMVVDKETRWDSSAPGPDKSLAYRYTLVNFDGTEVPANALAEIQKRALANYRTNAAMKSLREMGVTLRYQYHNKSGAAVGEFSISPKDF